MKLNSFLSQAAAAAKDEDGEKLAKLLRYGDFHAASIVEEVDNAADIDRLCQNKMPPLWDEVVAAHLRVIQNLLMRQDVLAAAEQQNLLVQTFANKALMNMGRRGLPAVYAVCADLEQLAYQADAELSEKNLKVKYLEEAARTINGVFSKCLNDRSASQQSRRWGTYKVMCMLFKIYFRLGNMHLCVSLTKVLKMQQDFPSLDRFPMAHQVTFRYYQGILDFFDEKYKDAEANLSFAFEHCPKKARKNKYLALVYLIPTRLLRGSLPEPWLLKRYPPIERVYGPLVNALRIGDLKSFDEELAKHELDLTAKGTYLTVERSRFLCIRNLFRKVYLIIDKSTRIPISTFQQALKFACYEGWEDSDDVECVLANMIDKGYMKGYISHERQIMVLAKTGPFPSVDSVEVT